MFIKIKLESVRILTNTSRFFDEIIRFYRCAKNCEKINKNN